jgi:hypothetical protein
MQTPISEKVDIKLFLGYLITSELQMHLKQSKEWKFAHLGTNDANDQLCEIDHKDKRYIGIYFPNHQITLAELKESDAGMRLKMKAYCPKFNIEQIKICVFPQLFLA